MAEHKRQHYIPRFYFKLFSNDGRSIEIYNLKSKNTYHGSYRTLCAKDYFYSKRLEVEMGLSSIEVDYSKVINKLSRTQDLSSLTTDDAYTICSFLAFQHQRTENEKFNLNESWNLAAKHTLEYLIRSDEKYTEHFDERFSDHVKVDLNEGHLMHMFHALVEGPILLNDLSPLILINNTKHDFIFSDDPVVLYNTYFNDLGYGTNGLANVGLQIFVPLNQKTMLILYDRKFYRFNSVFNRRIYIDNDADIASINALQFFNCKKNIFFSKREDKKYIQKIHSRLSYLIEDMKPEASILTAPDKSYEYIMLYNSNIRYTLKLTFMDLIPKSSTEVTSLRNPEIAELCRNMSSEIIDKHHDLLLQLEKYPENRRIITEEFTKYIFDIILMYNLEWLKSSQVFDDW